MSEKLFIIASDSVRVENHMVSDKAERHIRITQDKSSFTDIIASDGYHTFEELYDHRITLFIALCRKLQLWADNSGSIADKHVWRSKVNGDGSVWEDWFILGIGKELGEQITYHLPLDRWGETEFAETLDQAPEFDGHTPQDVLERLKNL